MVSDKKDVNLYDFNPFKIIIGHHYMILYLSRWKCASKALKGSSSINTTLRMRENCVPSTLDLILTNDENLIEELNYSHWKLSIIVLKFIFLCHCYHYGCL